MWKGRERRKTEKTGYEEVKRVPILVPVEMGVIYSQKGLKLSKAV